MWRVPSVEWHLRQTGSAAMRLPCSDMLPSAARSRTRGRAVLPRGEAAPLRASQSSVLRRFLSTITRQQ